MTDFKIGENAADDTDLIALWSLCGLTRPWNDPQSDINLARQSANATILFGTIADQLIASVMVGFDGHRGWVYYLAVDPQHRGRGYGRTLMLHAEDWLPARNCPALRLMVRDDNIEALDFYKQLGFDQQKVTILGKSL